MRVLAILFILVLLCSCGVAGPINLTMEEAADEYGLETEYWVYESAFDSPVQPAPERPKPPVIK